ncbi:MAG: flagellar hook-basal body complex protein [Desulfobacterales bacterium]|nr:flagellar hook-basal body complex protein [Desulfobacterales bacterium]MCP4161726.1 flagellar hook-basal body complex protein [Deltaproteobacteria bacterium]
MSLSSSLYSGISGLSVLGNSMTVVGDNIANVNTVGFKSSRALFEDALSQTVATSAGSAQVGRGVRLADVDTSFKQGSFEATESETDLAIGGDGFFIVRHPESVDNRFFTRAGEFKFDKDGKLTTPAGYVAQGWELKRKGDGLEIEDVGSVKDIKLESFTSPPDPSTKVSFITNLDARRNDPTDEASTNHTIDIKSQFDNMALSRVWKGSGEEEEHIMPSDYEYHTTEPVYDSLGNKHDISTYYDAGNETIDGKTYEFIIATEPTEDARDLFNDKDGDGTDQGRGLLARGVLEFDYSGALIGEQFQRFIGNKGAAQLEEESVTASFKHPAMPKVFGDYTGVTVPTGETGSKLASIHFSAGKYEPIKVIDPENPPEVNEDAPPPKALGVVGVDEIEIYWNEFDKITIPRNYTEGLQLRGPDGLFVSFKKGSTIFEGDAFDIKVVEGNPDDLNDDNNWVKMSLEDLQNEHYTFTPDFLGAPDDLTQMQVEMDFGSHYNGLNWVSDPLSSTSVASASSTIFQTANGYGAGSLQSLNVDVDGVITGQYDNGQVSPLYRVALGKFQNPHGLHKEGGNLFKQTRISGSVITNKPGINGVGSIAPNSLEQSNVDIANQFVKMITTQRGFQANSKIVTTVDGMMGDVIQMKR